jgi:hypothetical protein
LKQRQKFISGFLQYLLNQDLKNIAVIIKKALYQSKVPHGYNITKGGNGSLCRIMLEETKEKLRGRVFSADAMAKLSASKVAWHKTHNNLTQNVKQVYPVKMKKQTDDPVILKYVDPVVTKKDAVAAAGNQAQLARILGVDRACVSLWHDEFLPPIHSYRILQIFPHLKK